MFTGRGEGVTYSSDKQNGTATATEFVKTIIQHHGNEAMPSDPVSIETSGCSVTSPRPCTTFVLNSLIVTALTNVVIISTVSSMAHPVPVTFFNSFYVTDPVLLDFLAGSFLCNFREATGKQKADLCFYHIPNEFVL
jgi:hypothetical protein